MATLKDHIRAVVKTRTTPSEASNASSIGSTLVEVSGPDYVASSDGYVNAYFHVASTPGAFGVLTNHDAHISSTQLASVASVNLQATLPVSKGQAINVYQTGFEKVKLYFIKTIGGGYKQYLPTLPCNRFGGAPWLRLKTTSETLPRLVAGSRSRLSVASSSRASHLHLAREIASTCRQQTVFASFGLRVPVSTLRFANPVAHNLSRQTVLQAGRKLVFLVPVDKGSTMRLGVRSSEGSSTSFLLSVASNNARMEVAA